MSSSDALKIANDTLDAFQQIEKFASKRLSAGNSEASDALAVVNTFTGSAAVDQIAAINDDVTKSLFSLVREPAISRIVVENEEGQIETYYICRTAAGVPLNNGMLAGYRTDFGKLAAQSIGDEAEVEISGRKVSFRLLDKLELKPEKSAELWDSINSIWRQERSCSGQLIPDTALSFSSATAGASPLLN
ncbi:hypothetical protein [Pseudomonas vranovensis]|uniref:hypothetical protein n=1 Tax=Pseudomonas vranovensis TaxID=321661 RepID=UPI003D968548